MKQNLAVDLDGCVGDYIGALIHYLRGRGIDRKYDEWKDHTSGVPESMFLAFDRCCLDSVQVIPGAKDALKTLHKRFNLVMVTARPIIQRTDTLLWVYRHFHQSFFSQIIFSKDKGDICNRIKAVALIDDNPKNLEQYSPSFCFKQPWNEDYKGARGDWDYIVPHVLALAKKESGDK